MIEPVFGDLKAAKAGFEREWQLSGGEILPEADRVLCEKCYMLGWVDSELRFMKPSAPPSQGDESDGPL